MLLPARSRPRARTAVLVALVLAVLSTTAGLAARALGDASPATFARAVAFSTPVPEDPRLDPASEQLVALLAEPGRPPSLNTGAYGQPVHEADRDTPRYRVEITRAGTQEGQWGGNVLEGRSVPVPDDARPSTGDDGKLVVVDREEGLVYDLWRAERTADGWRAEWGGVYPLDGSGSSHAADYGDGPFSETWPDPLSRGTGSGISSLAGLLRADELAAGRVEHALVLSTDRACGPAQTGPHRWPATTTDGWVTEGPCLPQGARVQLDPSVDLESIPGITPVELVVGRTLQEYGAYVVDIGGARAAIVTEVARTREQRELYERLFSPLSPDGRAHPDYQLLRRLPMDRARVLARWDGS